MSLLLEDKYLGEAYKIARVCPGDVVIVRMTITGSEEFQVISPSEAKIIREKNNLLSLSYDPNTHIYVKKGINHEYPDVTANTVADGILAEQIEEIVISNSKEVGREKSIYANYIKLIARALSK